MIKTFQIRTEEKESLIDITKKIKEITKRIKNGTCTIFIPHTTAGITINENADPDVKLDIIHGLNSFNLKNLKFKHLEGNSPAHIKSSLIGASLNIIIQDNQLILGTWQGILFCEFDGPRTRTIIVKILED
ncbi:MAG: secondary thiamine-phosphate synthase enzyme YjbQ [Nanoarchaeota archaeon]|nr:secondary thiamine-phosphate synthase enzyme YjbQ [Nanoarchaeota archaeon]